MRVRVRTDRPRALAGALIAAGSAVGVRLDGRRGARTDTTDTRALAHALAPLAREHGARLFDGSSLTPTSRACFATWRSDEHGCRSLRPSARVRARGALPAAPAHAAHRAAPTRHRRGLRGALDPDRRRARSDSDPSQAAADAVAGYGFGRLLAALWLGTSAVGDLVEDRLLVYVWLKPVPALAATGGRAARDRYVLADGGAPDGRWWRALATSPWMTPLQQRRSPRSRTRACSWRPACGSPRGGVGACLRPGLGEPGRLHFGRGRALHTVIGWASSVHGIDVGLQRGLAGGGPRRATGCSAVASWLAASWRYARADVD